MEPPREHGGKDAALNIVDLSDTTLQWSRRVNTAESNRAREWFLGEIATSMEPPREHGGKGVAVAHNLN